MRRLRRSDCVSSEMKKEGACLIVEVEQADYLFDLIADRQRAGHMESTLRRLEQSE